MVQNARRPSADLPELHARVDQIVFHAAEGPLGNRWIRVRWPGEKKWHSLSLAALGAVIGLILRNEDVDMAGNGGSEETLEFFRSCRDVGVVEACNRHNLRPPSISSLPLDDA